MSCCLGSELSRIASSARKGEVGGRVGKRDGDTSVHLLLCCGLEDRIERWVDGTEEESREAQSGVEMDGATTQTKRPRLVVPAICRGTSVLSVCRGQPREKVEELSPGLKLVCRSYRVFGKSPIAPPARVR